MRNEQPTELPDLLILLHEALFELEAKCFEKIAFQRGQNLGLELLLSGVARDRGWVELFRDEGEEGDRLVLWGHVNIPWRQD